MGRTKGSPMKEPKETFSNEQYLQIENSHLKGKNLELIKANSELKVTIRQIEQDRNLLQKENMSLLLENKNHEQQNKNLQNYSKSVLSNLCKVAEDLAQIIYHTNQKPPTESVNFETQNTPTKQTSNRNEVGNAARTQAVKPMISGHVIHRPTIILPRLQAEELQRLTANLTSELNNYTEDNEEIENDVELQGETNSETQPETAPVRRLDTLPELRESVLSSANPELPNGLDVANPAAPSFISGIIHDVNVRLYIPSRSDIPPTVSTRVPRQQLQQNTQQNEPTSTRHSAGRDQYSTTAHSTTRDSSDQHSPLRQSATRVSLDQQPGPSGLQNFSSPLNGNSTRLSRSLPRAVHSRRRFANLIAVPATATTTPSNHNEVIENANSSTLNNEAPVHSPSLSRANSEVSLNSSLVRARFLDDETLKIAQLGLLGLSPTRQLPTSTPNAPRLNLRTRTKRPIHDWTPSPAKKPKRKRMRPSEMAACRVLLKQIPLSKGRKASITKVKSPKSRDTQSLGKKRMSLKPPKKTRQVTPKTPNAKPKEKKIRKPKVATAMSRKSPLKVLSKSMKIGRPKTPKGKSSPKKK